MDFLLAYLAGLLTLINPCILPVLPIVVASAAGRHPLAPLALATGMALSFVILGVTVTAFGAALGLSADGQVQIAAWAMLGFGLVLLVPRAEAGFGLALAGVSARAGAGFDRQAQGGLGGAFTGGALLGALWSPCIGPILGGAIALASQGQALAYAAGVMAAFALGAGSVMLALAYGARGFFARRRAGLQKLARAARPLMGAAFVAVALLVLTKTHHRIEAWALDHMPIWLSDLSVTF